MAIAAAGNRSRRHTGHHLHQNLILPLSLLLLLLLQPPLLCSAQSSSFKDNPLDEDYSEDGGDSPSPPPPKTLSTSSSGKGGSTFQGRHSPPPADIGEDPSPSPPPPKSSSTSATFQGAGSMLPKLIMLPKNRTRGRCLDGSQPGYYLRKGYGSGARKWLLFLEGGGWCFSIKQCAVRANSDLGSSLKWKSGFRPGEEIAFGGIASPYRSINPDFYNWNVALVKYCDGGSFAGNFGRYRRGKTGTAASVTAKSLHFRGHWNIQGSMQDMLDFRGMAVATDVLLAGCSAGGQSVSLICDAVSTWMGQFGAKTKCVMDAGFFLDTRDIYNQFSFRSKVQKMIHFQKFEEYGYNTDCQKAHPRDEWKCFFPQYNLPYVKTPIFIINSVLDYKAIALTFAPRVNGEKNAILKCLHSKRYAACTPWQKQTILGYQIQMRDSIVNIVRAKRAKGLGFGYFFMNTKVHCVSGDSGWRRNYGASGLKLKSLQQAVHDWWYTS